MILIDTSVWIDFFRGSPTHEKKTMEALIAKDELICITDVIMTEILRGIQSDSEYHLVRAHLESLPCLTAKAPKTFLHAADLYRTCRKKGRTIRSTVDCLIAAVCIENKIALLHRDTDFDVLADCCGLKSIA